MKIGLLIAAIVALVAGGVCGVAGGMTAASDGPDKWFGTGFTSIETQTHALVADPEDIADKEENDDHGGSKIRIGSSHSYAAGFKPNGGAVFLGAGPAADVERYLTGVSREYIMDIDRRPLELLTEVIDGQRTPGPPGDETFWVARAVGMERQEIRWRADDQLIVVMRADGAPKVTGEIAFSEGMEYYTLLAMGVGAIGTVMFIAGVGLLFEAVGPMFREKPQPGPVPPI